MSEKEKRVDSLVDRVTKAVRAALGDDKLTFNEAECVDDALDEVFEEVRADEPTAEQVRARKVALEWMGISPLGHTLMSSHTQNEVVNSVANLLIAYYKVSDEHEVVEHLRGQIAEGRQAVTIVADKLAKQVESAGKIEVQNRKLARERDGAVSRMEKAVKMGRNASQRNQDLIDQVAQLAVQYTTDQESMGAAVESIGALIRNLGPRKGSKDIIRSAVIEALEKIKHDLLYAPPSETRLGEDDVDFRAKHVAEQLVLVQAELDSLNAHRQKELEGLVSTMDRVNARGAAEGDMRECMEAEAKVIDNLARDATGVRVPKWILATPLVDVAKRLRDGMQRPDRLREAAVQGAMKALDEAEKLSPLEDPPTEAELEAASKEGLAGFLKEATETLSPSGLISPAVVAEKLAQQVEPDPGLDVEQREAAEEGAEPCCEFHVHRGDMTVACQDDYQCTCDELADWALGKWVPILAAWRCRTCDGYITSARVRGEKAPEDEAPKAMNYDQDAHGTREGS